MNKYPKHAVTCAECGAPMKLKHGRFGKFYGCTRYPDCDGVHGAHQESGEPLGTPADKATRAWRIRAHDAFDRVWRSGAISRNRAYRKLAGALGLTKSECHIGNFDIETCRRVVEVCELGMLHVGERESA